MYGKDWIWKNVCIFGANDPQATITSNFWSPGLNFVANSRACTTNLQICEGYGNFFGFYEDSFSSLVAISQAKFTDIRIVNVVGGDAIEGQFDALADRPDVIVATPGRLMHHLREVVTFKLNAVKYLVFDEADRLFEMGVSNFIRIISTDN